MVQIRLQTAGVLSRVCFKACAAARTRALYCRLQRNHRDNAGAQPCRNMRARSICIGRRLSPGRPIGSAGSSRMVISCYSVGGRVAFRPKHGAAYEIPVASFCKACRQSLCGCGSSHWSKMPSSIRSSRFAHNPQPPIDRIDRCGAHSCHSRKGGIKEWCLRWKEM
ncbi:hypothetical protein COEREDRAFT_9948 [Coemansia reversa NRRL 1564]|uniref:Uncharacterized protein n=1 Tax=Coemansia reversa (strain ATCC 12441 / NRRL 1564) TaxID=763665 RepID=A0A2G5B2L0_COERN|nr:hypothetical protein COEREDRAFT_11982 [Coemansia reversa NRRL 1564]PIA14874.1 hypothetical protein COEREDRAFT_9948 [Coemansia reversa NRRL 1564]|eukprot:PIA12947.1 hypothetical protein COEREDRAFT_11982 [Coemansia reversa NRRL 1564]